MQLHTSSITLRIMAASLCYSILLTYPTVGSCTAFFFSRKGGRRCKETVGECFLYTGTSLPQRLPYISICDEVTEIRRQTFLFFFFCLPWQWGILFLWFLSSFPQPLLLCPLTSSLFYSGKSFIFSLVNLIHATGRETKPDTRTETLQDRKEKELLITKTKSVILFL